MPTYKAPLADIRFVLDDLLDVGQLTALPGYADATPDLLATVLEEAAKLCEEVLAPLNQSGDAEGCHYENGVVRTPRGFREGYDAYREGGWPAMVAPPEFGGQGLPHIAGVVLDEMLCSANLSFSMYPLLAHGSVGALERWGDEELKRRFLPRLVDGSWTGTMCLTEPHAGTDLGLIRTRAVPAGDGAYLVTGTKIFISAGEHDLTDNIVHLVLARLPDAPPGTKGISLFVVPKRLPTDEGLRRIAERRRLRVDRAQDGDQGERDVRHELRERAWLARRRPAQGHARHVHDDERRATRRRHAGARPGRGELPERRGVHQGAPAGPVRARLAST